MKIFFGGDIVGRPGRRAVSELLPALVKEKEIDFVVLNAENAAGGSGITPDSIAPLFEAGCDVLTLGDHAFRNKDGLEPIGRDERILRPANLSDRATGRGTGIFQSRSGAKIGVLCLLGRIFIATPSDNPFLAAERLCAELRETTPLIIVDFHAEATSEKIALGRMLDGQATVVAGTHTHVQTADERVLPDGTAYITDLGMCGPHDSVLGRQKESVIKTFLTDMPARFDVARDDVRLCGALIDADEETGRARNIERICLVLE